MKVVIIGGVAGGASAAARLRRLDEKAEILLLERGPYISFANCGLPYYVGGVITDRAALTRMMRVLTDDAARLTQGVPALADTEPELALEPARLTVTFGFGPRFVERAGGQVPGWLAPLPAFQIDKVDTKLPKNLTKLFVRGNRIISLFRHLLFLIQNQAQYFLAQYQPHPSEHFLLLPHHLLLPFLFA